MPPLIALLPTIASIAGIAGAGTSIGEAIANRGGPAAPTAPGAPAPTPPDLQTLARQRALIGTADANTQGQTSGTAGDFYRLITDQLNAGTLGQPGSQAGANATVFKPANSQPTNAATGNVNLSDFINNV